MERGTLKVNEKSPHLPPTITDHRGGGSGWKLLTTASDHVTAYLIEGNLISAGIETLMDSSNPSPGAFLKPFGDPLAPVAIYVRTHEFQQASLILHELDHQPVNPEAAPSRRVRRLWLMTLLAILVAAVLMVVEIFDFAPCVIGAFCF